MAVEELNKPQYKWCEHCKIGNGCSIYGHTTRPETCQTFECLWLRGNVSEEVRPDKAHVIFDTTEDGMSVVVQMDPHYDVMNLDTRTVLADMYAKHVDILFVSGDRSRTIKST